MDEKLSIVEKEGILSIVETLKGKQCNIEDMDTFGHSWFVFMKFDKEATVLFVLKNKEDKPLPLISLKSPSLVIKKVKNFTTVLVP